MIHACNLYLSRTCSFLYVLTPNATTVDVLKLESAGNAQNVQKLDLAGPSKASGLTISEYHFYLSHTRALH